MHSRLLLCLGRAAATQEQIDKTQAGDKVVNYSAAASLDNDGTIATAC